MLFVCIFTIWLFIISTSDDCQCDISTITASATYIVGQNFDDFISASTDPLAPWNGISTHFKGTNSGGTNTIYEYKISCVIPCWIQNVNVQGAAWRDSKLTLYDDATSSILGSADFSDGNVFRSQNLDVTGNEHYLTQFRLKETNTDTTWRYRELISITEVKQPGQPCSTQCVCNCNCQCPKAMTYAAVTMDDISDNNKHNVVENTKRKEANVDVLYGIIIGLMMFILIGIAIFWRYAKNNRRMHSYESVKVEEKHAILKPSKTKQNCSEND